MSGLPDLTGNGDVLLVREGNRLLAAPPQDQAVVRAYPDFEDKGPVIDGYRLTLMPSRATCRLGEPVRFFHICESLSADRPLYVMGPKQVLGEYVDGHLATDQPPVTEDPLAPPSYDGRVSNGPGIDANYEVTEYRFETVGVHTVAWRLGPHASNTVRLDVSADGDTPQR
jgi:hypothetical protein